MTASCCHPDDTQGCILVGDNMLEGMVVDSRIWLQRLINAMIAARDRDESIWITIQYIECHNFYRKWLSAIAQLLAMLEYR